MKMSTPGLHSEGFPVAGEEIRRLWLVMAGGEAAGRGWPEEEVGAGMAWGGGQLGMGCGASLLMMLTMHYCYYCYCYCYCY
ncbi:hypothetical protein E2C01_044850 [Portunus trituberculatus]|uniref:Uncharacterized protein n=1 Tax=Portunus trituberculatus TaxID=210409 RepID=A0A5B7G186_PORTR|nr:hypothetical protein [Portunus trituberculatus]